MALTGMAVFYVFEKANCLTKSPYHSEKEYFRLPTAIYRVSTISYCGLKRLLTKSSIMVRSFISYGENHVLLAIKWEISVQMRG